MEKLKKSIIIKKKIILDTQQCYKILYWREEEQLQIRNSKGMFQATINVWGDISIRIGSHLKWSHVILSVNSNFHRSCLYSSLYVTVSYLSSANNFRALILSRQV